MPIAESKGGWGFGALLSHYVTPIALSFFDPILNIFNMQPYHIYILVTLKIIID